MGLEQRKKYPPKVEAIYRAIIGLLNQGCDIHQLKVSDIAKQAGIGKGTAYEYFSSKEEMIAGALVYDTSQLFVSLYRLQEKEISFERKLSVILTWLGENLEESHTFARMVTVGNGTDGFSRSLQKEIRQMADCRRGYLMFIDELMEEGRKQGKIKEIGKKEARFAMISQVSGLILCLMRPELHQEISAREAAEIANRNILRLLQVST